MGEDANGKGFESYPTGDSVSENHPTPCKRLFFRPTESYPINVMIAAYPTSCKQGFSVLCSHPVQYITVFILQVSN